MHSSDFAADTKTQGRVSEVCLTRLLAGSTPAGAKAHPFLECQAAKGAAAYERSEDPVYVLENNLPIDTEYYLTNQLSKPLSRLFEVGLA